MLRNARVGLGVWRGCIMKGMLTGMCTGPSYLYIPTPSPLLHFSQAIRFRCMGWQYVGGVRGISSGVGMMGHTQPYPTPNITSITMNHTTDMLKVEWNNGGGESDLYPYIWLRDNCQCSSCCHPNAKTRTVLVADLDINIYPTSAQVTDGGNSVMVIWSDGHQSTYDAKWLQQRAFNQAQRNARAHEIRLERKYWGSELQDNLPRASFPALLSSDIALLDWLQQLEAYGFVQIDDAPPEVGQVLQLAERVAFIKKTHYGEEFIVAAKPDPSNVAYGSGPLQLHADLPYYEYKPGVQLIHCIVQYEGDGGESQISDAIHVARELKRLHPHLYDALTQTPVDWRDVGNDEGREFNKVLQLPMICTDSRGEIVRVNVSQPQRDSHFSIPVGDVALWYTAMLQYFRLLAHPRYCIQFKMAPGTILSMDNLRTVHGRSSYRSGQGDRIIQSCYIDWDEVRSRRRVLQYKLESSTSSSS